MQNIQIKLGDWRSLQQQAQTIRTEVFVLEQQVPQELEWDEMDARSLHALAYSTDKHPIGTGRLLPDGHIGRMAVLQLERGHGAGAAILHALMRAARERGDTAVMLHAQIHAAGFYQKFGFERVGEEFLEAGIRHVAMRCNLLPL
ncbi:MAG: GNAT family N-acetyltransferase [Herbaspirillum sp.]